MYSFYLNLLLQIHKRLHVISCGIYNHNRKTNTFFSSPHVHDSMKSTNFRLRIYMLLLFLSFSLGFKQYTILQNVLSAGFVASQLGTYCLFIIAAEQVILDDMIGLLNKMIKFENGSSCLTKLSKYCMLKNLTLH